MQNRRVWAGKRPCPVVWVKVGGWYVRDMRVKTSVTLPSSLLEEIDRLNSNRSAFLEQAANVYLAQNAKRDRNAKDAAILEKNAERLNREAADVLEYQNPPD